jgi:hypothetical protein
MTIRGMILAIGSLCAALALGWWASDFIFPERKNQTSIADASCKSKWVKNAQNDPALLCYLETQPERLCNPSEKQHLAELFDRYAKQTEIFKKDLLDLQELPKQAAATNTAEVALVMNANVEMMNSGSFQTLSNGTKSVDPMESPELRAAIKKIEDSYNAEAKRLKTPALLAAMAVPQLPRSKMVAAITKLGEAGYLQKSDFGWFPDAMVADAFADITNQNMGCANK